MSDISETSGRRTGKGLLLFVLVPALITGFFSILPTIYNIATTPRAALSYDVVSGPAIPLSNQFRRIFAVSVQNTGKSPLNNITIAIPSDNGHMRKHRGRKEPVVSTFI